MDKIDKRTYCEKNRFTGFFNDYYSTIIKAYAYHEGVPKSKAIVKMCKFFIAEMGEDQIKIMVQRYKNENDIL